MEIEPVTPDDDSLDDERLFAERWERWKREKQELNALRGEWPQLSTDEILQWIHEGREESYSRIERAIEESRREREQGQRDDV